MKGILRNRAVTIAALVCVFAGLTGCATSASSPDLIHAGNPVVFGKLELVKNDERVSIGDGFLANAPVIYLEREDTGKRVLGKIGVDGEFAWRLAPGDYRVSKISFHNHGQRVETRFRQRFTVDQDSELVYIGTIKLVTRFFAGYHGVDGVVGYSVRNDCPRDCSTRLEGLGMTEAKPYVALLRR